MDAQACSVIVKALARRVGFHLCGIAQARPIPRADYFRTWLDRGRAGTMHYLHRYFNKRIDPCELLPGARSVIVVGLSHHVREPARTGRAADGPRGRIARYAWGEDYHRVVKEKLARLMDGLRERVDRPFQAKLCVDTAPIVEREWAAAAGIGWIGKNTLVLHPVWGSYFFLGVAVVTLELAADEPMPDHCGTCTACLDACPTQAFPAPYEMDASRCISYLTIEHRGEIPESLAAGMGDWIFGCDVCQEVCPHNRQIPETTEPRFAVRPPAPTIRIEDVLAWTEEDYRARLRGSAMKRAKLDMWRRNARIVQRNAVRSEKQ